MAEVSIVKKSELEGALRIDAEYYRPRYLEINKILKYSPLLSSISSKITDFGAYSQTNFIEYQDDGIRFLRNQDISEVFIANTESIYITENTYKKLSLKLEEGDIVIPRVGTLGKASVITEKYLPCSANQNLAQVKVQKGISPYYVSVFLSCRYGLSQIFRCATGNVQPWLNLQQISNLKIYLPDVKKQLEVEKIAIEAISKKEYSENLYSQAEQMLLEELGIEDLDLSHQLFYTTNLNDTKQAHRIDAEYYQPKYERVIEKVKKKVATKSLGELVEIRKGVEPGSEVYQNSGIPFVRVSNLTKYEINDNNQQYLSEELYNRFSLLYQPKVGEVLLSKDATPGIALVVREDWQMIISGGILRLSVNDEVNNEYLALILNSPVVQYQIQRDAGGSIINHWRPDQIKNTVIPTLSKPKQQKLADFVLQSHQARKEAKELLEEAKEKVEKMILEKNSEKATECKLFIAKGGQKDEI
ncbi:MAG: restriction endonuclease subunit S [bacterium]